MRARKDGTCSTISPARRYQEMTTELVERTHAGRPMSQRWWVEYDRVRRAAESAHRATYTSRLQAEGEWD